MPGGGRHCGVHLRLFNRICVMSKLAWLVVVFVLGFGGPVLGQRNVYVTTTVVNDYTVGDGSNFGLMLGAFPLGRIVTHVMLVSIVLRYLN